MADERLDVRLAYTLGVSRSRAEKLIRDGSVRVGGVVVTKPGAKVAGDAAIEADVPPPAPMDAQPEDLPLSIIYEDAHMAVINKAAGMVVHPAAGNMDGTLVNALLYHLDGLSGIGGTVRPGIVHRLDKDTSGLMLVAKDDAAHVALSAALKDRRIHKTYLAVTRGGFKAETGVIDTPIARHPQDRKRMATVQGGRDARTEYRVLQALHGATLLAVDLITGRTHQIRVHMASVGHPLLGDPLYGGKMPKTLSAPRVMLHAWRIALSHPVTGAPMAFAVPPPEDFISVVTRLGGHVKDWALDVEAQ